jgi:tRNA-specific 2-thiouridylase
MPKKVIVAMSGGVDSSVSAALLKRAGFDVEGVFLRLFHSAKFTEAAKRAKKVAQILKIPFRILDLQKQFKKKIINCFLKESEAGLTPNPCVVCNKEIKFGFLLKLGADLVATGHYARLKNGRLFRAKDKNKDQSYFLWKLGQRQLRRVLFPLGNYTKDEVRKLAKKFKLPIFGAAESQDICFKIPSRLTFYTIGQRKGIGLSNGPFWVFGRDAKKNLILTKNEKDLYKKELFFKKANWLAGKSPKFPLKVKAKIRYRSKLASAVVYKNNRVVFSRPQRAITPGQSIVFYKNQELLGGGIISR